MSKEEYKLSALPVALITSQPNGFYYGIQTIVSFYHLPYLVKDTPDEIIPSDMYIDEIEVY